MIEDEPFDLSDLKSNYRYKINKDIKNFDVRVIKPRDYIDELYEVSAVAFESWPIKYRHQFTHDDTKKLAQKLLTDPVMIFYGVFYL